MDGPGIKPRAAITGLRKRGYAVTRERIVAGESVYRISGAPAGSGDRVVQTEAVDATKPGGALRLN